MVVKCILFLQKKKKKSDENVCFIPELTTWQLDFYRQKSTHPSFQLKTSGWTLTFLSCSSGKRNTKPWSTGELHQGWKARAKTCILLGSLMVPVLIWQEGRKNLGFSKGESTSSTCAFSLEGAANGAVNGTITLGAIWLLGKEKNVHTLLSERAIFFPTF